MHLTTVSLLSLLLHTTISAPNHKWENPEPQSPDAKWLDLTNTQYLTFNAIVTKCVQTLKQYQESVTNTLETSNAKLNDRTVCRTIQHIRAIVNKVLNIWEKDFDKTVSEIRIDLNKYSDIFVLDYELLIARFKIIAPEGAGKYQQILNEGLSESHLVGAETMEADTLNNTMKFFSGRFHPGQEFQRVINELPKEKRKKDVFEGNLAEAFFELEAVKQIHMEIVESVEETVYRGLQMFLEANQEITALQKILETGAYPTQQEEIAQNDRMNKKIQDGIRISKNIKAIDLLYMQVVASKDPNIH